MFFCRWDGARHHGTAHFYCAVCLVPMLLRGAGIDIGNWPDGDDGGGGGGIGAAVAAAREELSVDAFDKFCADMSDASKPYRLKWRAVLGALDDEAAASVVADRIGAFAGGRDRVESAMRRAPWWASPDGTAAAVGVAEASVRAVADQEGDLQPPGSAKLVTDDSLVRKQVEEQKEIQRAQQAEADAKRAAARPQQQQAEHQKVRHMGE
jgi:hypothetical protein